MCGNSPEGVCTTTIIWALLDLQVYLDGELMKTYYGKESAPPGSYNVPGALGRQVASTKESAPGIKIGTSLRALDYTVSSSLLLPSPDVQQTQLLPVELLAAKHGACRAVYAGLRRLGCITLPDLHHASTVWQQQQQQQQLAGSFAVVSSRLPAVGSLNQTVWKHEPTLVLPPHDACR
jgi:hypothetical protein